MLFDSTNLFSDAQAITATAASTNVIDFGATDTPKHAANAITRDLGKGNKVALHVQVVTDFADTGDNTSLTVALQTDTVENFASPTTLWTSETLVSTALVAGYIFPLAFIPRGVQRYLRLNYTVSGTGDMEAGAITAGLVFAQDERDV
jgi:hypothetical protein